MNIRQLRRPLPIESAWLKFAALQFIYWFVMGIGNYQAVFLQEQGITASTLGVINAAISTVTIIATPLWGMASDRIRSVRKIFLLTLIVSSVFFAFIPTVINLSFLTTPLLIVYLCAVYLFRNPANSFFDSWLVRYSDQKGLAYGSIRCFGSLGFTVVGLMIVGLVSRFGTAWTFPVCSLMMSCVVLLSLFTDDARAMTPVQSAHPKKEHISPMHLLKDYYFVTFLLFTFLYSIVSNCRGAFLPYLMKEVGVPSSRFGVINAYIALIEIPMLLLAKPLRRHLPLYVIAPAGCLGFALSCSLMGLCANSLGTLMLFETFTGIGSGLIIASAAYYAYTLSPESMKATGQSLYVAAASLSGIVGNLMGGRLLDTLGARPFYTLIGCIGFFASALFALTLVLGPKIVRRPPPRD